MDFSAYNVSKSIMELNINWHGYVFQDGLKRIIEGFGKASDALHLDVERTQDELMGYQADLEQGGEWIGEQDEEGYVIWSQEDVLQMKIENAQEALRTLRNAFVLIVYHHWERSARSWTGLGHAKHGKLASSVQQMGYPIHDELYILHILVNTLKHDSDTWGLKLLAARSALLTIDAPKAEGRTNWYGAVKLSDAAVTAFFNCVAASGPTIKTKMPD